ncbi:hypothetical protein [Bradyrhizobium sp. CCBAU 53351]|uniref:hypothetical protein n=1 Tax=Bradyrhizobium sp. CCBAU 53351 TaxID=1325114 RepID=UPI001887070F|nr:hypothetical protein [Bradyrhizobium sp. CCBAU 53351]
MGMGRSGCAGQDHASTSLISTKVVSPAKRVILAALGFAFVPSLWIQSVAAEELQVLVNGAVYVVNGTEVARQGGHEPVEDETRRQALLTAGVLNEQIRNSDSNRAFFSPANRAAIFADQASGRLVESWQRSLPESASPGSRAGESALAAAKQKFKAWAAEAAANPNKLALAVVRTDYLNGIAAYRENAAIYRKIVKQNAPLSYDEAIQFLSNQLMTARLARARSLEEQLMVGASDDGLQAAVGQPRDARELAGRIESEIGRIGQIRSPADLEQANQRIRRIAESSVLQGYRESVKPPMVRLSGNGAPVSADRQDSPSGVSGDASPQGRSAAEAPANAPAATSPQGTSSAAAQQITAEQRTTDGRPVSGQNPSAAEANRAQSAPEGQAAGAAPDSKDTLAARNVDRSQSGRGPVLRGTGDNLQTYSSKGYHSPDGFVFNPSHARWENPADPTQTRIPAVMLCCDETGLAFPGDSLEAHQQSSGEWDGASVDPNCGRLYACGAAKAKAAAAIDPASPGPADKDQEILRGVEYLAQLPEEDRDEAFAKFIVGLPSEYRRRAILAVRAKQQQLARPQNAPARQAGPPSAGPQTKPRYRESDVSGLSSVSSRYDPVTQTSAKTIVSKYQSIPGGVTLEGIADLKFANKVTYLAKANAFILNDDLVYVNPVTADELAQIYKALLADDKLGVSLGEAVSLVYGALPKNGTVVRNLKTADRFLGAITFTNAELTDYKFLPGYVTKPVISSNVAVYFNISEIALAETDDGELKRSRINLATTLVPLTTPSATGGHLPDGHRIARGDISPSHVANLKHLQDNFSYYARERIVRTVLAYGEVAAFARALNAANLKLDLK